MGYKFNPLIFMGLDLSGSGAAGDVHWQSPVANQASLPLTGNDPGDIRVTLDTGNIWEWDGTVWFLPAVPYNEKGAPNGVAPLDGGGKVPYVNLPNAIMTYKGTWNPTTNTPTLVNGTGQAGDVYRASVDGASTTPMVENWFAGDFIIYDGAVWQRSPLADGVVSVNGLSGVVVLTANDVGAANQNLSNLNSPTAVNQHLIPDTNNTRNMGSDLSEINTIWTRSVQHNDSTNPNLDITVTGNGGNIRLKADTGAVIEMRSDILPTNTSINAGSAGAEFNQVFTKGISGDDAGTPLTLSTSLNGNIVLSPNGTGIINVTSHLISNVINPVSAQDAATKNYVDTGDALAANKTLSNLANPTNINQNLIPTSDDTLNLGSPAKGWGTANIYALVNGSNVTTVDPYNALLNDNTVLGNNSIDWAGRSLFASDGSTAMFNWNTVGVLDTKNNLISNVLNPVSSQDAATKNYVDGLVGANKTLSNLTNPTSINQSLIPNTTNTLTLGNSSTLWSNLFSSDISIFSGVTNIGSISLNTTPSSSATGFSFSSGNTAENILFFTPQALNNTASIYSETGFVAGITANPTGSINQTTGAQQNASSTGVTGSINLNTGNNAGTGSSGAIVLTTGTGSTRGQITFKDGTEGTAGYVWTSTDTTGKGAWMAAAGGGANVTLSNLTSPTAINQDLIFDMAGQSIVQTKDQITGASKPLLVKSGDVNDTNSGNAIFQSGDAATTAASGDVTIASGATVDGNSGQIQILTGAPSGNGNTGALTLVTSDSPNASTGTILLATGSAGSAGNTGTLQMGTGNVGGGGGTVGSLSLYTGNNAATGNSGDIDFRSGTTGTGNSGQIQIHTGNTQNGNSGALTIGSDDASVTGDTGAATLRSGNSNAGTSGGITISTGNGAVAAGNINITVGGTPGTPGFINLNGPIVSTGSQNVASRLTTGNVTVDALTDRVILMNDTVAGVYNLNLPAGVNGLIYRFAPTSNASGNGATYVFVANGTDLLDANIPATIVANTPELIFNSGTWYASSL